MLWSRNLQLDYPFQNTALDYSGNARHGTVFGSGVYATKPNGSRCLYFDGVGDYVATPSFGLSGTVVVFATRLRLPSSVSVNQSLIGDNTWISNVGALALLRFKNTTTLAWYYGQAGAVPASVSIADYFAGSYDDSWLHLCVVSDYTADTAWVYRDAVLFATVAMPGNALFPNVDNVKYIGSWSPTMHFLTGGYLADVYLGTLDSMPPLAVVNANVKRLMLGMHPIW